MMRSLLMPLLRCQAVAGAVWRAAERNRNAQAGAVPVLALDLVDAAKAFDALLHAETAKPFRRRRIDAAAIVTHHEPDHRVLGAVAVHHLLDLHGDAGRL